MAKENEYAALLTSSTRMIAAAKAQGDGVDEHQIAELYGIYYNAFAGLLRDNSVMYKKQMDIDGYPKIVISLGDSQYSCSATALRDILREDYVRLTSHPYEDTSASYVKPYTGRTVVKAEGVVPQTSQRTRSQDSSSRSRNTRGEEQVIRAEQDKQIKIIEAKNKELTKLAKNFKYDPNYDHYYNDRLPAILKELDANGWTITGRIACMALSCAGIVMALAFL